MDQARQSVEPEVMLDIFKRTMPFQVVSDAMLRKIAAVSWRVTYEPGAVIYDAGDKADDIYIVVSGKIEHALEPVVQARRPEQTLKSGDVFGWAALLEKFPARLAKAVCIERAEVVRINGDELLRLLESDPDAGDVVMSRFATMIRQDYTVPDLIAQLRTIHRKLHAGDVQGIAQESAAIVRVTEFALAIADSVRA